jgi:hypothetical protein
MPGQSRIAAPLACQRYAAAAEPEDSTIRVDELDRGERLVVRPESYSHLPRAVHRGPVATTKGLRDKMPDRLGRQQDPGHDKEGQSNELADDHTVSAKERGDADAQDKCTHCACKPEDQGAAPADASPHTEQKQTRHDENSVIRLRGSDIHADPVQEPRHQHQGTGDIPTSHRCHAGRVRVANACRQVLGNFGSGKGLGRNGRPALWAGAAGVAVAAMLIPAALCQSSEAVIKRALAETEDRVEEPDHGRATAPPASSSPDPLALRCYDEFGVTWPVPEATVWRILVQQVT